jgi:saposin
MRSALLLIFALLALTYAPQTEASSLGCDGCKFVVTWIEGKLADNATEATIVADLEKFCSDLPSSLAGVCNTIAANYVPEVISYLENDESPAVACGQIKLCPTFAPQVVPSNDLCSGCEALVGFVESWASNGAAEDKILAAIEGVCNILPSSVRATCQNYIAQNGATIIADIINKENPTTLCTQLSICASSSWRRTFNNKLIRALPNRKL